MKEYYDKQFDAPVYSKAGHWVVSNLRFRDNEKDTEFETKKIILEIDLNQNIKYIKQRLNEVITLERERLMEKRLIDNKRKSPDVMANAIKVYRLIKKDKKWEEIAKEIFPEDFRNPSELKETDPDPNPESAIVKVKQYYKRAEELIREIP